MAPHQGQRCGQASWSKTGHTFRTNSRTIFFLGGNNLAALDPVTAKQRWDWTFGPIQHKRGVSTSPRLSTGGLITIGELEAFDVRESTLTVANGHRYAAQFEPESGELIFAFGGLGQFELHEETEVVSQEGVEYWATSDGVTKREHGAEVTFSRHQLLSCDNDRRLAMIQPSGQVIAVGDQNRVLGKMPASDVATAFLLGGELQWITADKTELRGADSCWRIPEPVSHVEATRYGFMARPAATKHPNGSWYTMYFFPFASEKPVATCRLVTTRARIVDIRP